MLANPNLISQTVLHNSLDAQTAFEIVSIDIADIEVGENIGAKLPGRPSRGRPAGGPGRGREAAGGGRGQASRRCSALVQENRAKVVLAEAEVPLAIAAAFRDGKLGVMDYYNMRNLQADTSMRSAIAGSSGDGQSGRSDR